MFNEQETTFYSGLEPDYTSSGLLFLSKATDSLAVLFTSNSEFLRETVLKCKSLHLH